MPDYIPGYIKLYKKGELKKRADEALKRLENCDICPHNCRVDRTKGERGRCGAPSNLIISGFQRHFGEEKVLVGDRGSGTIFFSNCNLSCVFCQNCDISCYGEGYEISEKKLADVMIRLQRYGCHNINLVSPSHYWPNIMMAVYYAALKGLNIPIVYNTGGYDALSALKSLDGIIDIYMPDIKFSDDKMGEKYAGVKGYFSVTKKAVKEMYRQTGDLKVDKRGIAYRGLLVRHLILPDDISGTKGVLEFIANDISKNTYVNLMDQYYPAHRAEDYPPLNRRITANEFQRAVETAAKLGLTRLEK